MKIKVISRTERTTAGSRRAELRKQHRNLDPKYHPFEKAIEYKRAVNAAKMDRMFAKPFVGALEGHSDGVYSSATSPSSLVALVTGAGDGEVRVWDIAHRRCLWSAYGHDGIVRGVGVDHLGKTFLSCSDDRVIKQWNLVDPSNTGAAGAGYDGAAAAAAGAPEGPEAVATWTAQYAQMDLDTHPGKDAFATAGGPEVCVWDMNRSEPLHRMAWDADTVYSARYSPSEHHLLAACGSDNSIALHDIREAKPVRRNVLEMRSNKICWNPRQPFNFTAACEDHCLYTFDMRNLSRARTIHKDHVSAVLDVSYSPTGKEFVSGSYDKTVRIYSESSGRSREIYHTKRMQRVFTVHFSADARYVMSGSDDTNVRVWKADASAQLGRELPRERAANNYRKALTRRYSAHPEVRKILRTRNVPKVIRSTQQREHIVRQSKRRKEQNRRNHSKPGSRTQEPERKRRVVSEDA